MPHVPDLSRESGSLLGQAQKRVLRPRWIWIRCDGPLSGAWVLGLDRRAAQRALVASPRGLPRAHCLARTHPHPVPETPRRPPGPSPSHAQCHRERPGQGKAPIAGRRVEDA